MSLRYRFALTTSVLVLIVLVFVLRSSLHTTRRSVSSQQRASDAVVLGLLRAPSREALLTEEYDRIQIELRELTKDPRVLEVILTDARGVVVAAVPPSSVGSIVKPEVDGGWRTLELETALGRQGALWVRYSRAPLEATIARAERAGAVAGFVGMLAIAIAGVLIGTLLTRRLRRLQQVASQLAAGDFSVRANLSGRDEIATLAQAFDSMTVSLEIRRAEVDAQTAALRQEVHEREEAERVTKEREQVLRLLYDVTADQSLSAEKRIEIVVEELKSRLRVTAGVAAMVDRERYQVLAVAGQLALKREQVLPLGETLAASPVTSERVVSYHPAQQAVPADHPFKTRYETDTYIGGPIRVHGEIRGVLEFFGADTSNRGVWNQQDHHLMELLTNWIGSQLEQRQLQARLVVSDRLASMGSMAAGVAHEINNPLTFILSNIDTVLRRLEEGRAGDVPALLEDARVGAQRIRDIVSSLQTGTAPRTEAGGSSVSVVVEFAKRMATSKLLSNGTQVEVDIEKGLCVVGNNTELMQVFLNLLVNASQAMPHEPAHSNNIRIHGYRSGQSAIIEVSDNGVGMDRKTMDRIFDPFYSTKPIGDGTGLGLFICHQVVSGLGGSLAVSSTLGVGTTFRIELPISQQKANVEPQDVQGDVPEGLRILVVDDERIIRAVFTNIFEKHEVVAVGSCAAARQALGLGNGAQQDFDVIFCDLLLPGQSGRELYQEIIESRPELARRFVFVTGGAVTELDREFVARPEIACLPKPFTAAQLRAHVRRISAGADKGQPEERKPEESQSQGERA